MTTSIIQLLDDDSINKIAAGEVIERPASVVKELVENSLDAGAKRIEVDIEAGGLGKIRVADDGCGMSESDVRMAVLRHATSKLRNAEELFSVDSLGFRGEAIPSIASVSKFSIVSRQIDAEFGTLLEIDGGRLIDVRESGAEVGTLVTVSDLFFNTPARLKFMKTAASESSHIHEALIKLSITRPDVTFRLTNNGRTTLHTPGTGRLSDVLSALYGPDTLRQLFLVDYTDGDIHIKGFAAKPSVRKGSRQWQSFAVNNRVIGSRLLNRAVDTAYQTLLPTGSYPLVALHIAMPSFQVDVNVHPQKAEVKFQDERSLFKALHSAIKGVLYTPENALAAAAAFDHSAYRPSYKPAYVQESLPVHQEFCDKMHANQIPLHTSDEYSISTKSIENISSPSPESSSEFATQLPSLKSGTSEEKHEPGRKLHALAQFSQCYILASDGVSLYIIDQHAAHERLLFDLLARKQVPSSFQTLLIPIVIDLDPLEVNAAELYEAELSGLGFVFDWVGPGAVRISELPTHIPSEEAASLFRQILSSSLSLKTPDPETFRQLWIETAACHMAVRAGQTLNIPQMQALLDDLHRAERPYSCPHGRPTLIRFTESDLARLFKRI